MPSAIRLLLLLACQALALLGSAQPHFLATATINGNDLQFKIKPVGGPITCGWTVFEFFFRNPTAAPNADAEFEGATITMNATDFPGLTIPYNGTNLQGTETGYNNYWFGAPFNPPTTTKTYNQNQEYLVCTITLTTAPSGFDFELCHNDVYTPHYLALTDEGGNDKTNVTGTNVFYGPDTVICMPNNCPVTTPGNNHILPLNGAQPVELVDFQARKHQLTSARLDWRTALELNFDLFEIERQRTDGLWERIWTEQGRAAPGDGAAYMFFDHSPLGPTAYYRLKMVDDDGSFAYSPIRSVAFDGDNMLRIYPNPASDVLYIAFGADMRAEDVLAELLTARGKVAARARLTVAPGATETLALDAYSLPAGMYLFRASSPDGILFQQHVAIQAGW